MRHFVHCIDRDPILGGVCANHVLLYSKQHVALLTMCMSAVQFGRGYLTPNNPNTVASIVQFGYSPDKLDYEQYGYAEVIKHPFSASASRFPRMGRLI